MSGKKRYQFSHSVKVPVRTWWGATTRMNDSEAHYVFLDQDGQPCAISAFEFWFGNPVGNYLSVSSRRRRPGDPA